jgi:geranylgeranyl diphosphate synthase type II
MDRERVERALSRALDTVAGPATPPRLRAALHHAVFPAGARLRPLLVTAIARAAGDHGSPRVDASAAAIELMHCASLVHDDLPCFDDAATRRGEPTVHALFGEALAVLAGDGLIVLAFESLSRLSGEDPAWLGRAMVALAAGVSARGGIIAGQAWESEPSPPRAVYRRAKTGALFESAAMLGAIAAGVDDKPWRVVGAKLGEAYQVLDDVRDVVGDASSLGKPVGRDEALGRPNVALEGGVERARRSAAQLLSEAIAATPKCERPEEISAFIGRARARLGA